MRRRVFTISLIGPDGTGKSTVSKKLQTSLPIPSKYVYMGINQDASNVALPTTLLWKKIKRATGQQRDMGGPPDPNKRPSLPKDPAKRMVSELKSGLRIANLMAEEWYRQFITWTYMLRGNVVIFDRHFFFDYYKYHIANGGRGRTVAERFHGFMLDRIFPKPDLVIFLDAPAEVLFARKGEGTVALLEQRRREYLNFKNKVARFVTVDTTQTVDEVTRQVSGIIMTHYLAKKRKGGVLSKSEVE